MAITIDTRNARRPGRVPTATMLRVGARARAFAAAQRHSRLVRLLRVLLPLTAVGIFAGYLLIVGARWLENHMKFKVGSVVITADDLTMKDPSYFDVTSDGRYEVRAKRAVIAFGQDKNAPIKLIEVSGDMVQTNGVVTKLKAKQGLYSNAKGELELFDGIEIDGSNGMMARLTRAMIYSKENKVVSVDPVSASTPTGSVQAASMTMNTKTRLVQFRGNVAVRLLPQQGATLAPGKDVRQPVDVRAGELDIDDASKTAHFREKVVAMQGESMLQAPYLMVSYEGKAAAGLSSPAPGADKAAPSEAKAAPGQGKPSTKEGARVTFLRARNGVDITAGNDRRIVSELADFDVAADTALFEGNVVATQEKNVLKGGRLFVDRKAGKSRLETPVDGGRIFASFRPNAAAAPHVRPAKRQPAAEVAQETMLGTFKADRNAPMDVEADTLEMVDASNKAVFTGDVNARQGDLLLRTAELTAVYSGRTGMGLPGAGEEAGGKKGQEKAEIIRLEARHSVLMTSKDQSASAKWATFDVKANTALLGGGVTVTKQGAGEAASKVNTLVGDRLKVDLTTGVYQFEADAGTVPQPQKPSVPEAKGPATSASAPASAAATPEEKLKACPSGRQCVLFFPQQFKDKALDAVQKRAPAVNAR